MMRISCLIVTGSCLMLLMFAPSTVLKAGVTKTVVELGKLEAPGGSISVSVQKQDSLCSLHLFASDGYGVESVYFVLDIQKAMELDNLLHQAIAEWPAAKAGVTPAPGIPPPNDATRAASEAVTAVEEMPVLLMIPEPIYPDAARRARIEGVCVVRALVGVNGVVEEAVFTEGPQELSDAAITVARGAGFTAGQSNHNAVPIWVTLPIRFSLETDRR